MNQRTKLASALIALALVFSLTAWSQETQPAGTNSRRASLTSYQESPEHFFRLTFRVLQMSPQGKILDSKSYSETVVSGAKSEKVSSIRTMDRVPIYNCDKSSANCHLTSMGNAGTDIDAQGIELDNQTLHLYVMVNISTISTNPPATEQNPIIRSTRWHSYVTVPINKPTIIFAGDDNADKGKTELELTAVPIAQ